MSRPEFVSQLADIWVKVGEPLSLECRATGIPLSETLWLRDGQEVSDFASYRYFYRCDMIQKY